MALSPTPKFGDRTAAQILFKIDFVFYNKGRRMLQIAINCLMCKCLEVTCSDHPLKTMRRVPHIFIGPLI